MIDSFRLTVPRIIFDVVLWEELQDLKIPFTFSYRNTAIVNGGEFVTIRLQEFDDFVRFAVEYGAVTRASV